MAYIKEHADTISAAGVLEYAGGKKLEKDAVAVTFDDVYADFVEHALPILEELQIPVVIFPSLPEVERSELGTEKPLLAESNVAITSSLVTLGSHALSHRKMSRLLPKNANNELARSREKIKERFGSLPEYFAYPKGKHSVSLAAFVKAAGYKAAFTVEPRAVHMRDDPHRLPRIQIDASTSFDEFKARLTPAADWYYAFRRFL